MTDTSSRPEAERALTLDVTLYEEMLADADLSEDEKHQFLEALWSIIVGFVDLGFEIHPVQLASGQDRTSEAGCGQNSDHSGIDEHGLLNSIHIMKTEPTPNPAGRCENGHAERKET